MSGTAQDRRSPRPRPHPRRRIHGRVEPGAVESLDVGLEGGRDGRGVAVGGGCSGLVLLDSYASRNTSTVSSAFGPRSKLTDQIEDHDHGDHGSEVPTGLARSGISGTNDGLPRRGAWHPGLGFAWTSDFSGTWALHASAWLLLESRDTPMHVGAVRVHAPGGRAAGLPQGRAGAHAGVADGARAVEPPAGAGTPDRPRVPLMREERDVDLGLPRPPFGAAHPGGQRELGILVSRLHGHQLDLHRPLWEVHLIEGLEGNRFAHLPEDASLADRRGERDADDPAALSTDPESGRHPRSGRSRPASAARRRATAWSSGLSGLARDRARAAGGLTGISRAAAHLRGDDRRGAPGAVPGTELGSRMPPASAGSPPSSTSSTGSRRLRRPRAARSTTSCSTSAARAAPLSERARSASGPSPEGRHPGQPARGRRRVNRDGDRDDGGGAGDQHRRPARAARGDQRGRPRRRRSTSVKSRPPAGRRLHAPDQRPVHRRAGSPVSAAARRCRSTSGSRTSPARPCRSTSTGPGSMRSSRCRCSCTATR